MLQTQLIYCGDNLKKLRELPDESVDLIYIDPPFNSNRNYEIFWGDTQEKRSFDDRFGAVEHYIHWMRPRVSELWRVLKKTGSLYYHCDTHANAYVRVMLDNEFGIGNFRNEIIWRRTGSNKSVNRFGPIHQTIYFYTKTDAAPFYPQHQPYTSGYIQEFFTHQDERGRFRRVLLTGPGTRDGDSGLPWRGYDPTTRGRHWQPASYLYAKYKEITGEDLAVYPLLERLDKLTEAGLIYPTGESPCYKYYLDDAPGVLTQDIWGYQPGTEGCVYGRGDDEGIDQDVKWIREKSSERLGYPTQKPLGLLNRIIRASSKSGDVVLDAFCGCGTTLEAAQTLGRRWIGIDISPTACRVMAARLEKNCGLHEGEDFWVRDLPKTAEELRKYPPFEFENWAVTALNTVLVGGHAIANKAKVGDMGIDGKIYPSNMVKEKQAGYDLFGEMDRWFPVQVKQKDKAGRPDIDSFETAMKRQKRTKGFFVSFAFTADANLEILRAGKEESLEIVPVTVAEILGEQVNLHI